VGETKLQKEVRLVSCHDKFAKEKKKTFEKERSHTSTCGMDCCGISKVGSMFSKGGFRMCF